jgi:hypothetical protein
MLNPRFQPSGLRLAAFTLIAGVASLAAADSAAQVSQIDRTVLAEVPYIAATCVDELLRINGHLVLCNDYSYPYHYGAAVLLAEKSTAQGRSSALFKLCLEGSSGRCLKGDILKRQ